MKTATIRPGLLVAFRTSLTGGVGYTRIDLDTGLTEAELREKAKLAGTAVPAVARWETTRTIDDPEEYERASKARGKVSTEIRAVCAATSFGLLCPEGREADLDMAMEKAHALVQAHNDSAACTRLSVYILKGRIAGTDEEAARAITQEVRGLIDDMNRGIERLNPKEIRDAATRAQEVSRMLTADIAGKVGAAVDAARRAARQIVKRVEKDGEIGAVVLADIQRGAIEHARIAFLDLEDDAPNSAEAPMPAMSLQRVAGLDVDTAPLAANGEE
jgi:hypothetical protein